MSETNEKQYFEVFTIHEYVQERQVKANFIRIGVGFPNKDGSFNIRLRALPITDPKTGTANLHMRLPSPRPQNENAAPDDGSHGETTYNMDEVPFTGTGNYSDDEGDRL